MKRAFGIGIVIACAALIAACASRPVRAPEAWEPRLQGKAIVLLGEVHDNAEVHAQRLGVLRRAFAAGWRPAIVMEQFDREHQADIDRARRERPNDAQHVIDLAAPPAKGMGTGWDWRFYEPFVALALAYDVPLVAANLSSTDTVKIVRGGLASVFDDAALAGLGLDKPVASDWQAAQEREIDEGHCHALPPSLWPRMASAQFARDAVMARVLREHAANGAVLIAGNGHARRDFGVPRWMGGDANRVFSVGYLEADDESTPATAYDAVVRVKPMPRSDPCAGFAPRPLATPASGPPVR